MEILFFDDLAKVVLPVMAKFSVENSISLVKEDLYEVTIKMKEKKYGNVSMMPIYKAVDNGATEQVQVVLKSIKEKYLS